MSQTEGVETSVRLAPEDGLRADLYAFLASILSSPPDRERLAQLSRLEGDGSEMGEAVAALARIAAATAPEAAEREYNALFIGLGRGELLPYASFYLTGFLNEKPLADLRRDMAVRGIGRSGDVHEPEDHMASLCEIMAGLIRGSFGKSEPLAGQRRFFETHVERWAEHFFTDLESAETSVLYAPVGRMGRLFMQIEAEAFRME